MDIEKKKEASKKYNKKIKQYACNFTLKELEYANILDNYLIESNQTVNSYLKSLIIMDLINKGLI